MMRVPGGLTVRGSVKAPSSKSYAQRAIAASLLADGTSELLDMELCSDTAAALDVACDLGATYRVVDGNYLIKGRLSPLTSSVNIGASGLSARMFLPIASLCDKPITFHGTGSILARPMNMIISPLEQLGATVASTDGGLPITVCGPLWGGEAFVDGSVSSQFITGLLMALPLAASDTVFTVSDAKSIPYIAMTLDVLDHFGVEAKHIEFTEFFIRGGQRYAPSTYRIEGDWSAAANLLVAGAIAGEVTVLGVDPLSKQADAAILDALALAGAKIEITADNVIVARPDLLRNFKFDATHCPDLFPPLVALAANCEGASQITGVHRLRGKECDRCEALIEEYEKIGIKIELSGPDVMVVHGGEIVGGETDSREDHRIAMSLALAGINSVSGVEVSEPGCVAKSYPEFWRDLGELLGQPVEVMV